MQKDFLIKTLKNQRQKKKKNGMSLNISKTKYFSSILSSQGKVKQMTEGRISAVFKTDGDSDMD